MAGWYFLVVLVWKSVRDGLTVKWLLLCVFRKILTQLIEAKTIALNGFCFTFLHCNPLST